MSASLPFLDAAAVHRALDYPTLVEHLRAAFAAGASAPLRAVHRLTPDAPPPGDVLLLMPAWNEGGGLGVKVVTVFPGNPARGVPTVGALYLLLDRQTGHARAVLDGEALTLRRTGAASALAARYLARPDARTLLVVGTGQLAPHMARAHAGVQAFERVLVWGRDPAKARALAGALQGLAARVEAAPALPEAVAQADLITCATTAAEPLVRGEWVRPGTHVDLVGGFTPAMREADDALVARGRLFVDTYAGALAEAGDLVQPLRAGVIAREAVLAELATLARGEHPGRTGPEEITVFKSVGTALEDLAAAELAYSR